MAAPPGRGVARALEGRRRTSGRRCAGAPTGAGGGGGGAPPATAGRGRPVRATAAARRRHRRRGHRGGTAVAVGAPGRQSGCSSLS